jgi:3-methyladenine DNA glycosylase AlkD
VYLGSLAILFLKNYREEIDSRAFAGLSKWFKAGIANWAHSDVLCGEVISPLLRCGRIGLEALAPWRGSPLKYQRRAVPVGMLGLLKTDAGIGPLLEFVRPLMTDGERVVHQGLGWFLREAWKKHPKPVEAFLLEYRDTAPRLIFQYATEKMTPAERARFRRQKAR